MTAVLGISAWYHDSAAALLLDGEIAAAAQEERFSRIRHDPAFPVHAIRYCLSAAGLRSGQIDFVAFYEKPVLHFDRLFESWLAGTPFGFAAFRKAVPIWLKNRLRFQSSLADVLPDQFTGRCVFAEHHESHAASAFFPSPFTSAAILTADGVGEWTTTMISKGTDRHIECVEQIRFPHSLGLLYSAFTEYLGFRVNSGEYKVMGLAPLGEPVFADIIRKHLIDLRNDGSFRLNLKYFSFISGSTMTGHHFHRLFGGPPRAPESELTPQHCDVAASIQKVTEEAMLLLAQRALTVTQSRQLVLAGGVALNCVANQRIRELIGPENLWIQPAAGDAGGALGAALLTQHQLLELPRTTLKSQPSAFTSAAPDSMQFARLGPEYSDKDIQATLNEVGARWLQIDNDSDLSNYTAKLLAQQKIVGWFQGRMEFGPRALGGRSILADPRSPSMQHRLNSAIKMRESFRPFAPVVLRSQLPAWFEDSSAVASPFMQWTVHLKKSLPSRIVWRDEFPAWIAGQGTGSPFPAVTHVDGSSRIQTVDEDSDPKLTGLLQSFFHHTGCPLLVNTSFNLRGEPIVLSPRDAWECFCRSELDALVIGNLLIERNTQPQGFDAQHRLAGNPFPKD